MIRRCTWDDPLYPLLDFLVGSIDSLSSMEFKRYDNTQFGEARDSSPPARAEPSLDETVGAIVRFLNAAGLGDLQLGNS